MTRRKKASARIFSFALSVAMVFTMLPSTVLAAEATPPGASNTECHLEHDKDCGYIEAVDGVSCSHQNEDGTYSCTSVSGNVATSGDADKSDCDHTDGCGYVEADTGVACTHTCELCKTQDSGNVSGSDKPEQTACADTAASNIILDKLLTLLADQQDMIAEGDADVTATDKFVVLTADIDALYSHVDICEICAAQMAEGGAYYEKFYGTQTLAANVCEINDQGYATLQAAVSAVGNGQTIKILSDITETSVKRDFFQNVFTSTINLNGFDITLTADTADAAGLYFCGYDERDPIHLILTDNSSGKAGTLTTTGGVGIYAGQLTVSKITLVATGSGSQFSAGLYSSSGPITIKDGAVVTATGEATGREIMGVASSDDLIVDNAVLYAISKASSYSQNTYCATNLQPKDAAGNKLNPNEDPTNANGWERLVATYGNIGSSITVTINGTEYSGSTLQDAISKLSGGATAVTSLKITDGEVTTDDWYYLSNLTALTTFEIDSAVTSVANIPDVVNGTHSIIIPKSIISITVPQPITIGFAAFTYCTELTTASFPMVTNIGMTAFLGCGKFATLKLDATPPTVGNFAFQGCPATRALVYLDTDGNELTDAALTAAQEAYRGDSATGAVADGKWYGWTLGAEAVTFSTLTANGVANITDTTELILTFDKDVTGLAADDITVTGATKGTLTKESGTGIYKLTISNITVAEGANVNVAVAKTSLTFTPANKDVAVHKAASATHKPVTDITGVPTTATAGTDLTLAGTVTPADATNKTIVWNVKDPGTTGATIEGGKLKTTAAGTAKVTAIIINGLTVSSNYTKDFTITVNTTPTTHTITASAGTGGSISPSGTVTVNNGESKTFAISANSNYSISSVSVDGANQGAISTYTFSNVTGNHTISATFSYNGGGGGSSSTSTPPTKDSLTNGKTDVATTVDANGNASVTVTEQNVKDAIKAAQDAAKKDGLAGKQISVEIAVTTDKAATQITATLPKTVQDTLISNKVNSVKITSGTVTLSFSQAAIQQINSQAKADVTITAAKTNTNSLTGNAKTLVGSRPMFDFKATYGGGKAITNFGTNTVSIAIPYTLGQNEAAGNVRAVYIDENGNAAEITNSSYDSNKQAVIFTTSHFSKFAVGYKAAAPVFTDITNHWAKTDIEFTASRGLLAGTSNTTFSPDTAMSRGMVVTALGRLAGADVSGYKSSNFTDVKADAYYMGYIEWAASKGIVKGVGENKFAPDQSITREDLAVIMQNYAKVMGYTVPQTRAAVTFTDAASSGSWATDAVKAMQQAGVMMGKTGNKFDPKATATLHRYVELVIDATTAEGWAQNDSGNDMCFQNGKAVTGTQTIGGVAYIFNIYGETTRKTATERNSK